jgi:two-component system LytT family response regulator
MYDMIRTIIIDDDDTVRSTLRLLLREYCPDVEVVGEAGNFHDAVQSIYEAKPDLVFMDVQLADCAGFEVLNAFDVESFAVIMMSSFKEYAVQAFDYDSKGYLLKPFEFDKLIAAVERTRTQLTLLHTAREYSDMIQELNTTLAAPDTARMMVKSTRGMVSIKLKDVITCSMHYGYVRLTFHGAPILLAMNTLSEWEQWLSPDEFMKIHRSHIINVSHVRQWRHDGKEAVVQMSTGEVFTVARAHKQDFIRRVEGE